MQFLINNFVELTVTGLVLGAVYGLVALGYTLVYGVLQLINFAHSEVWMFGSFAAVWVTVALGVAPGSALPVVIGVLLLALLAAMTVSGGVALLLERVAYRRLIRLDAPKLVALISAIGASFALAEIMGLRDRVADWLGLRDTLDPYVRSARDNTRFQNPLETEGLFTVGGYTVTNVDLIIIVSAVLMMVALDQFIRRTRTGKGIRAVAQDSEAAALMGVNRNRVIRATFLVGGIMAGAAALLGFTDGELLDAIIDAVDAETGGATGRSYADAPEIDGEVHLRDAGHLSVGDIVRVHVEEADDHDLFGVPDQLPR